MSDQRISGNPSSPWHNYSETAPTPTGNNSVSASSRRAGASGNLPLGRQAAQHPPTLQPGMVSRSSIEWLAPYQASHNAGERALAAAVIHSIQNGSLTLGNPALQTATRAQYGQRLESTHGAASVLVQFRSRTDGRFDLVSAGMRDSADPDRRVTITAPQNARPSGQAQPIPNPAPVPPSAPAQMPQVSVQHPENQVAGPSSQPLQPVFAPPALSAPISRSITQIVNGLVRWDQRAAGTLIETRLRSAPANEQQSLLMHLNTQLSGKASDAKLAVIQNWAATASVSRAMEGRDMRTDRQRELDNALAVQNNNPAFRGPRDEILDMLPSAARQSVVHGGVRNGRFISPLYLRVFRDSRGPVAAIREICDLISPLHVEQRYQAIRDWTPRR